MRVKFIFVVFVALCSLSLTIPEEYKSELKQMKESFETDEMRLSLVYNVYLQTGKKLIDTKTGSFDKSGNQYYYTVSSVSIIQNNKWVMYLDESDQIIIVKESEKKATSNILSFDLAIEACESVKRTLSEGIYKYEIKFKGQVAKVYSGLSIYAKKSDLTPLKIVMDYAYLSEHTMDNGEIVNDKFQMEIKYISINNSSVKNFSTDKYFVEDQNQELKLKDEFKNFTLIDQRMSRTIK